MKPILIMFFLAIALPTALGGCVTTQPLTIDRSRVVIAPSSLYNCPKVSQWPEPKPLSDLQVARLLVQLSDANKICRSSVNAIRKYYETAKARIEGPKK